jgi:hypothetical protein
LIFGSIIGAFYTPFWAAYGNNTGLNDNVENNTNFAPYEPGNTGNRFYYRYKYPYSVL